MGACRDPGHRLRARRAICLRDRNTRDPATPVTRPDVATTVWEPFAAMFDAVESRPIRGQVMGKTPRAFIVEGVYYRDEEARLYTAARGEYDVCRTCDGLVTFCHCETREAFALSVDAVGQHVCEGRIKIAGGKIPDETN